MRKCFFIITLFIFIGCQGAKEKSFTRAKTSSSYDIEQEFIHLNGLYSISANDLFNIHPGETVAQSTENIFYLTSSLFALSALKEQNGRLSEARQIRSLAYRILDVFESSRETATYFTHENSSYLELALGLALEGPENLESIFEETLNNQKAGLDRAIRNISNEDKILLKLNTIYRVPELNRQEDSIDEGEGGLVIDNVIQFYIDFINNLPETLENEDIDLVETTDIQERVDSNIISSVRERVENEFSPMVEEFRSKIQRINKNQSLKRNLRIIESAFETLEVEDAQTGERVSLLGESFETVLDMVRALHPIADSLLGASGDREVFDIILQIWTHPLLQEEGRLVLKERNSFLYNFLNDLNEEYIEYLKRYNVKPYHGGGIFKVPRGMFNFKKWIVNFKHDVTVWGIRIQGKKEIINLLNTSINEGVILELDKQIRSYTPQIVREILNFISAEVDSAHNEIRSDMFDVLRREGRVYLDNLFGSSLEPLRGFELQGTDLVWGNNNNFKVERRRVEGDSTSAKLIGLSMMTHAQKMAKYDKDLNIDPTGRTFYRDIFSELNKLISVSGYRLMESPNLREPSFFRPVIGRSSDAEPDIFFYGEETGIFSIPHVIPLRGALSIDKEKVKESRIVSDIGNMAMIVRGASLYMEYFKDWKENNLDQKFVSEGFQLNDQADLLYVFPKDDFYALALGLASVPLRNLEREGVYVYTNDGEEGSYQDYLSGVFNKESVDPIVQVAVADLTSDGMGNVVRAADLAQLIMAADEFISATDEFEKSENETILWIDENGERINYIAISEGRELLYNFIIGLANFLSARMVDSDGGVFNAYSIKDNELIPWFREQVGKEEAVAIFDRKLHDQLIVMQAMARATRRTGIRGYADIGFKIYKYLMDSHYQNTGVFNSIEGIDENSILLTDAVQLILSLEELSFVLDNSIEAYQQIQDLKGLYTMRLMDIYRETQD